MSFQRKPTRLRDIAQSHEEGVDGRLCLELRPPLVGGYKTCVAVLSTEHSLLLSTELTAE